MALTLTPAQRRVYDYVRGFIEEYGHAPSHEEICAGLGFKSRHAAYKHLLALKERGYLSLPLPNKKRAIELLPISASSVSIPFLGTVAAGIPIEAIEVPETIDVPESFLGKGANFALKVKGDSMIDEGIRDGDVLIVNKLAHAESGWMVVVLINGEATVKRIFRQGDEVELRPSNSSMAPIRVKGSDVQVVGNIVGLLRHYRPRKITAAAGFS
jgi:repressor LexA